MSIGIASVPERYGLAYNDNPFVFFSTLFFITEGQRFEVQVVNSDTLDVVATERVYPRVGVTSNGTVTENRAYYDPSRILQTQVETPIAIPSNNHPTYFDAPNMYFNYSLVIWEEIKNAQGVYERGTVNIQDKKTVWNGGVNLRDWLNFDYVSYNYSAGSSNKYLTNAPRTQYINEGESAFLYFLNSEQSSTTLTLESFTGGVSNGTSDLTFAMSSDFGYVAIGYQDIRLADASDWSSNPFTLIENSDYYTITLAGGETHTYYINARCSKYEPIRLHWLNRLGGFDSFNFSLKSKQETEIDRRSYRQQHHDFTGSNWQYTSKSRGTTDYYVGLTDKLTINTPFLTEDESTWMEDFASSPVVYQEINNQLIAMSGKAKMIDKKTSLNDKLMQYEFELDYSLNNIRQRG